MFDDTVFTVMTHGSGLIREMFMLAAGALFAQALFLLTLYPSFAGAWQFACALSILVALAFGALFFANGYLTLSSELDNMNAIVRGERAITVTDSLPSDSEWRNMFIAFFAMSVVTFVLTVVRLFFMPEKK